MNLALSAVLLAVLLIPPLIFLFFYNKGTHARGIPSLSIVEYFLISSVIALFSHCTIIFIFNLDIDYKFLFKFVTGNFRAEDFNEYERNYKNYIFGFAKYIALVCFFSGLLGIFARFIVTHRNFRRWNWLQKMRSDRKPGDLLCYYNHWWYFFKLNEYTSTCSLANHLVYVDVLVDTKEKTVIYTGILYDFILKEDDLHYIILENVQKRPFNPDANDDLENALKDFSITPRDGYMLIPYNSILNMYLRFVGIEKYTGKIETSSKEIDADLMTEEQVIDLVDELANKIKIES